MIPMIAARQTFAEEMVNAAHLRVKNALVKMLRDVARKLVTMAYVREK